MSVSFAKRFAEDCRGNVTIMMVFLLPLLIGVAALVAEYGYGLVVKGENQRVADLSAYAAALAYETTNSEESMQQAAERAAELNGVPGASATASFGPSPRTSGSNAITVRINTENRLFLAPVLGVGTTLPISASATVEIGGQAESCILALDPSQSGVTLTGGTAITANKCAVASNASISVPCGTSITSSAVSYNSSPPSVGCSNGLVSPDGSSVKIVKASTPDPLATNAGILAATGRFAIVRAQNSPFEPNVSVPTGVDLEFPWWNDPAFLSKVDAIGCSASYVSSAWNVTCPSGGTYNFRNLVLRTVVNFNIDGSDITTYNFSGDLKADGGTLKLGPGNYNIAGRIDVGNGTLSIGHGNFRIAKGIKVGGNGSLKMGYGTFRIGQIADNCIGGRFSICVEGSGRLEIEGPSDFELSSGIYAQGSGKVILGKDETQNTYRIGSSSNGFALNSAGSAQIIFGDALGNSSVFQLGGNVSVTGGGTCTVFPAADEHDIRGYLLAGGAAYLRSGTYTIDGYAAFGAHNSGNANCEGFGDIGVKAENVSLVLSGTSTASGACSGQVFCVASGYSNVTITAPTSGPMAKLAIIGPTTSGLTGGAALNQGARNASISGALYFPNGAFSMSGGASIGGGSSQCLQIVGSRVSLSGGTAASSTCVGGSGGSSTVRLIN